MRKLLFATLLFSAFLTAREPTAEDFAAGGARNELVEEVKRVLENFNSLWAPNKLFIED